MRRLMILAALVTSCFALAACGDDDHEVTHAETEGIQVVTGGLTYQVQISRLLNPADVEDAAYIEGVPPVQRQLGPGEEWFAIFLRVKNDSDDPHPAARTFVMEDTTGKEYHPVPLDSVYAYEPLRLGPDEKIPVSDSPAATNTPNGSLLLFKIDGADLENRPLGFIIHNPTDPNETAVVDLDV